MKNVQVLYVGGMALPPQTPLADIHATLARYLELQLVAKTDITVLTHLAGVDVQWDIARTIGQTIMRTYDQYDGFVVIHSLDNAVYIANLLTFLFAQLGKPIIFTGRSMLDETMTSLQSLTAAEQVLYQQMSLQTNLLTAVQLATMNCGTVLLAYGPEIVRAVRAVPQFGFSVQPFLSWHEPDIARVQFGVQLDTAAPARSTVTPVFSEQYTTAVRLLTLQPSLRQTVSASQPRVIILAGGVEQGLPAHFTWPADIPIIVHCPTPATAQSRVADNVIYSTDLTFPAVVAKAMVAAATTKTISELRQELQHNYHGEYFGGTV